MAPNGALVTITVQREAPSALPEYASVAIAFETDRVMRVASHHTDSNRYVLSEEPLPTAISKDYDTLDAPASWPNRFDLSRWMFFGAYAGDQRVGGAVGIMRSPDVWLLDARDDVALLWDIRVALTARRVGVGSALLQAVETWAAEQGARWLKVETQDINVAACRFYDRHGFCLRMVNPRAYPNLPGETQLLWYKEIGEAPSAHDHPPGGHPGRTRP